MNYFDIIQYFESKGIDYKKSGKNIGKFIGVKDCPFCGDSAYHLGYDQQRRFFSCWKCGSHDVRSFLYKIEKSWHKVNLILENYKLDITQIQYDVEEKIVKTSYNLPREFTTNFTDPYKLYLKNRNFDFLELRKKYNILCGSDFGRAKYRIVFPVYENNRIVNWVARTILKDKSTIPYMFEKDENLPLVNRRELLYGLDSVKKGGTIILTEGVLDACRIGDGAVAMLSVNFSKGQLIKIKDKRIKKAYLMFDNDPAGEKMSKKLESFLTFIPEVNYIEYPSKDPDSLDLDSIRELRRLIS